MLAGCLNIMFYGWCNRLLLLFTFKCMSYMDLDFLSLHFLSISKLSLILTLNLIQCHTNNIKKKKKEKKEMHLIIVIFLLKEREKKGNVSDLCRLPILLHWEMKVTAVTTNNGRKFHGAWSIVITSEINW